MKILFISVNKEKSIRPVLPIGMITVATQIIAQGYSVECLDLCFEYDDKACIEAKLNTFMPDLIGISVRNIDSQSYLEPVFYSPLVRQIVDWCREISPNIKILLGGAGFSQIPQELLRYSRADYGIVSFGETSVIDFIKRIENNQEVDDVDGIIYLDKTGNIYHKEPTFKINYSQIIPHDRSLYDPRYFTYSYQTQEETLTVVETVQTKRGCIFNCIFCSNFLVDGRNVTLKPVIQVVDEIEHIIEHSHVSGFEFVDSVFNYPIAHAIAVCNEMKKRNIHFPWTCQLSPGAVTDELASAMQETGCTLVDFGTDSCSTPILQRLNKQYTEEDVIDSHRLIEKYNIGIMQCVFVGNPGDDRSNVLHTLDILDSLVPDKENSLSHVYLAFGLRIPKHSELEVIAKQQKVLADDADMGVPRFYVSPDVINDPELLDIIESRVVSNRNWYMWWGLPNISFKDRVKQVSAKHKQVEDMYMELMRSTN